MAIWVNIFLSIKYEDDYIFCKAPSHWYNVQKHWPQIIWTYLRHRWKVTEKLVLNIFYVINIAEYVHH